VFQLQDALDGYLDAQMLRVVAINWSFKVFQDIDWQEEAKGHSSFDGFRTNGLWLLCT